jgi:hypothetical protein
MCRKIERVGHYKADSISDLASGAFAATVSPLEHNTSNLCAKMRVTVLALSPAE